MVAEAHGAEGGSVTFWTTALFPPLEGRLTSATQFQNHRTENIQAGKSLCSFLSRRHVAQPDQEIDPQDDREVTNLSARFIIFTRKLSSLLSNTYSIFFLFFFLGWMLCEEIDKQQTKESRKRRGAKASVSSPSKQADKRRFSGKPSL